MNEGDKLNAASFNDLENRINEAFEYSAPRYISIYVPTNNWSDAAPYTQTVNVADITEEDNPQAAVILSQNASTAAKQLESWNCVSDITTNNGNIVLRCLEEKPTEAFTVQLEIHR